MQILCLYDSIDAIDVDKVVEYIKGLQQEDGSFAGDKWGKNSQILIFVPLTLCLWFLKVVDFIDLKCLVFYNIYILIIV